MGPSSENEILNQNPRFEYIVGMLAPQTSENDSNEQEIDGDASFEGDADYTAGEDDDNEPVFTNRFKTPSSIGISFYLESSTKSFNVDVTWGDYTKASDKTTNKEGKEVDVSTYKRHPQKETVVIDLQEFSKNKEYPLVCDSNVILYVSKIGLKQGYTLITAYVNNKRKNPESDIAGMMFQVNLRAYSQDKMDIFVAEHICRKILAVDEFYFAQRPILGRGRGCAATWKANKNGRASEIVSTFIPEYEFPGVSAALEGFDPFFFSIFVRFIRYPDIRFRLLIPVGKCYAENTFCRFKLWRGWSILICTFNFFDFCAITFNQSHPGEDSRKVRISRL